MRGGRGSLCPRVILKNTIPINFMYVAKLNRPCAQAAPTGGDVQLRREEEEESV